MAIVRPFRAIRPACKYADKVISLPYDVMNREEASEMAQNNPYSFLHICRSEIDIPLEKDQYSKKVYEKAKSNIKDYLKTGVFIEDAKPMLYIYKQVMDGRAQTGIVGCVSIDEYKNNIIKKHEFTRVEKEIDRINHFDTCDANTEPVFLTYRDNLKIRTIIEGYISNGKPEYEITTVDGIEHTLWAIDDSKIVDSICKLFGEIPALYIADGHHRSASACKVGEKRREENPGYTGEEEFNFFMAVIFPDNDLKIFDYNRVVKDLNGNSTSEFIEKVRAYGFEITQIGEEIYRPEKKHEFGMFLEGKWYKLTAKNNIIPENIIDSLDVAILQNSLLHPILGIEDPRTDKRIDFVGGIRGLEELEKRTNDDMKVAFAVYPVDVLDLLKVADNNMVMPPKSTWFEPKLGSGLFIHKL